MFGSFGVEGADPFAPLLLIPHINSLLFTSHPSFQPLILALFLAGLQEVCHFEDFEANCGEHEVVVMQSAHYGLMRVGRCMDEHVKGKDCTANVLSYMDSLCSGKRNCSVRVADEAMHNLQPCKVYLGYLEAEYDCIKGNRPYRPSWYLYWVPLTIPLSLLQWLVAIRISAQYSTGSVSQGGPSLDSSVAPPSLSQTPPHWFPQVLSAFPRGLALSPVLGCWKARKARGSTWLCSTSSQRSRTLRLSAMLV